jgi:hypothetical protein
MANISKYGQNLTYSHDFVNENFYRKFIQTSASLHTILGISSLTTFSVSNQGDVAACLSAANFR